MKNLKKNMFGFVHHAVLGMVVVGVITVAGIKVLTGIHAQSPRYLVGGYVTSNGSPLAGYKVHVMHTDQNHTFIIHSGAKGWYQFYAQPDTRYTLSVFKPSVPDKCIDRAGTTSGTKNLTFQTGSTGGSLRENLSVTGQAWIIGCASGSG